MVIKIRIEEVKGRKATVSGRVEDLNGTILVEASSTFVQPRYAYLLQSPELRKAMGEPSEPPSPLTPDSADSFCLPTAMMLGPVRGHGFDADFPAK